MDIFRFLRALQARGIERIEQIRSDQIKGRIKADAISADEWEKIREHDEILSDFYRLSV